MKTYKKTLLTIFGLILCLITEAQISGTIIDEKTKEPVAFVNIGLKGKSIGTVSNEYGRFYLRTTEANELDTLMITVLGYKKIMFSLATYKQKYEKDNARVELTPELYNLSEVTILPKVIINKTLGNTNNNKIVSAGFESNNLGSEVGVTMHVKKKKRCFIDTLCFNINNCKYDSIFFRVNIYTMKANKPDSSLLVKPLYVLSKGEFYTLKVNVIPLNLEVNDDFFVSLEWLKDLGKGGLDFPAGFTNTHSFFRDASHGIWEKAPAGVGFYCKIRQEK